MEEKMKKKQVLAIILSAILMSSTLTACGVNKGNLAENTAYEMQESAEEKVLRDAVTSVVHAGSSAANKEETVFVKANPDGSASSVIVSNWLKNTDGTEELDDTTELTNIKNVKGKESFSQEGDSITWEAQGSDIYYQGTTDKQLPIELSISYLLDGKSISPEELAGKSGNVTIHFDYINHAQNEVEIGNKVETIYTPFAVVSGMLLNNEKFSNIKVTNGTVLNDANRCVVVGMAFPGLVDSLNGGKADAELLQKVEEKVEIPSSFEVNADVTDFELGMTLTMVSSDVMSSLGLDSFDAEDSALSDAKESMQKLTDASTQLVDGTADLQNGAQKLSDGTSGLVKGSSDLYDGVVKYTEGVGKVAEGAGKLNAGVDTLIEGTGELSKGVGQLDSGISQVKTGAASLKQGVKDVNDGAAALRDNLASAETGAERLATGAGTIKTGADSVKSGADTLKGGIEGVQSSLGTMQASIQTAKSTTESVDAAIIGAKDGAQALLNSGTLTSEQQAAVQAIYDVLAAAEPGASGVASGLGTLDSTIEAGKPGVQALVDGAGTLSTGAGNLSTGAAALASGASDLKTGVTALHTGASDLADGTKKLSDGATALAKGADELATGASQLKTGAEKVDRGVGSLKEGTQTLVNGTNELTANSGALVSGSKTLADGSVVLVDGISQLLDGSIRLHNGMVEFDREGVSKLASVLDIDSDSLAQRVNAIVEASKAYSTFSGANAGADSCVKFIMETGEIK